jgi:hypothetical protein
VRHTFNFDLWNWLHVCIIQDLPFIITPRVWAVVHRTDKRNTLCKTWSKLYCLAQLLLFSFELNYFNNVPNRLRDMIYIFVDTCCHRFLFGLFLVYFCRHVRSTRNTVLLNGTHNTISLNSTRSTVLLNGTHNTVSLNSIFMKILIGIKIMPFLHIKEQENVGVTLCMFQPVMI